MDPPSRRANKLETTGPNGESHDPLLFHPAPNPAKIALLLEEAGLPYEASPLDTSKGYQHAPSFRTINPNGKVPAIVDTEGPGARETRVFDSTAILIYLAEKTGKFLGAPEDRPELLSWLLFIASGLGPFSGQAVHFQFAAPEGLDYAVNRYRREAERHYQVLNEPSRGSYLHRRRDLHHRRHLGLGLARPRLTRAQGRRRSARAVPEPQTLIRDSRCATGRRSRA
jgi:glutathione S-transferase